MNDIKAVQFYESPDSNPRNCGNLAVICTDTPNALPVYRISARKPFEENFRGQSFLLKPTLINFN